MTAERTTKFGRGRGRAIALLAMTALMSGFLVTMTTNAQATVANDGYTTATQIGPSGQLTGDTSASDTGEMWYSHVAEGSGDATVTLSAGPSPECNPGWVNLGLHVYQPVPSSDPQEIDVTYADWSSAWFDWCGGTTGPAFADETITFPMAAGGTYYIAIKSGSDGPFTMTWNFPGGTPVGLFSQLQAALDNPSLPATDHHVRGAEKHLAQALDARLWDATGAALAVPKGERVFDRVREAADQLDHFTSTDPTALQARDDAVAKLWAIAQQLASDAVGKAAGTPGARPHGIEAAQRELQTASLRWDKNHNDAFEHLKQAWKHAEAAIKNV